MGIVWLYKALASSSANANYPQVIVPCDEGVHAKVQFTFLTMLEVVCVGISLMITTASPWRDKFSVGT